MRLLMTGPLILRAEHRLRDIVIRFLEATMDITAITVIMGGILGETLEDTLGEDIAEGTAEEAMVEVEVVAVEMVVAVAVDVRKGEEGMKRKRHIPLLFVGSGLG